jgi:hypothetical protein
MREKSENLNLADRKNTARFLVIIADMMPSPYGTLTL